MNHKKIYEKLRAKLDKAPVGVPEGLEGEEKEILKILFSEEEAEFAQNLPFSTFTVDDLSEKTDLDEDSISTTLNEMAEKGTVLKNEKNGKTVYRLLPVVIGWFETPFWPGLGEDSRQEKLAPLWDEYWVDEWLDELGDRETSVNRTLPEKDAISSKAEIMPYEDVVNLVKGREDIVVAHCPCRIMAKLSGGGCRHTLENCLHFGSMARYMDEQDFGRKISEEEALEILKEANQEGLVHTVENHSGRLNVICNCCDDCCMFFRSIKEAGNPNALAKSNYHAEVDLEDCIACSICAVRCPMNAVSVKKDKEPSEIDEERCIGCGACHPTCPVDAINLVKGEEPVSPPKYKEYLQALLEERGKDLSSLS